MNPNQEKTSWNLLAYFTLSLLFALLAIVVNGHHIVRVPTFAYQFSLRMTWLFWLSISLSIVALIPLLRDVLEKLHDRSMLPSFLEYFFKPEFRERIHQVGNMFASQKRFLAMLLCGGSGGILLIVILLFRSGALEDDYINSRVYQLSSSFLGRDVQNGEFHNVAICWFTTQATDLSGYLENCLSIVKTLKEAGAKVVMIPLMEFTPGKANVDMLFRALQKTDVVVFGKPYAYSVIINDSANRVRLSEGVVVLNDQAYTRTLNLASIKLVPYRDIYINTNNDILLELLRKYRGYPHDVEPRHVGNKVILGDDALPVTGNGMLYSRDRLKPMYGTDLTITRGAPWTHSVNVSLSKREDKVRFLGDNSDSLFVRSFNLKDGTKFRSFNQVPVSELAEKVRGKIVLLMTNAGRSTVPYLSIRAYGVALENVLAGKVTRKPDDGFIWFSVVVLVLSGVGAYFFKPLVSILCTLLIAVMAVYAGSLLYDSYDVLFDIFYPLLSLAFAAVCFPLIKAAISSHQFWE